MWKTMRGLLEVRAIRFALVGALNTGFSYGLYALFLFAGFSYPLANLAALLIGMLFSFRTQGKFVFRNTEQRLLGRFIAAWLLIYLLNIWLINLLIRLELDAYRAGALAIFPVTALSYLFQRFYVFRPAPRSL